MPKIGKKRHRHRSGQKKRKKRRLRKEASPKSEVVESSEDETESVVESEQESKLAYEIFQRESCIKDRATRPVCINLKEFHNAAESNTDDLLAVYEKQYVTSLANMPEIKEGKSIEKLRYGKKAREIFNKWLQTRRGTKAANNKLAPRIRSKLTKMNRSPEHPFGECLLTTAAKSKKGSDFKCSFMNKKGSDSYVHHVALAANATLEKPLFPLEILLKISSSKRGTGSEQLTISHLCGNGACVRPGHLIVEPKKVNEERRAWHKLLRLSPTKEISNSLVAMSPHSPKTFTNLYVVPQPYY